MSEVIVRMEMPKRCYDCDFADGVVCRATGGAFGREVPQMTWIKTRPSWCPIIGELPEQHGDLINREYAIASACSGLTRTLRTTEGEEKWIRVKEVRESIKSAPIIVPAERSET